MTLNFVMIIIREKTTHCTTGIINQPAAPPLVVQHNKATHERSVFQ